MKFKTGLTLATLLAGPYLSANAQSVPDTTASRFTLSGFGTLGLVRASNPDADPLRDVSQPEGATQKWSARTDSIVGVQGNLRLQPELEVVTQVVSHYRQDGSFRPEVTWAFAKFEPNPRLQFRAGRVGTEFLMQSDSRMVGYSYLPVRPNIDYFGGVPINYADGADAQVRWPAGDGVVRASVFVGVAREKLRTYETNGSPVTKASLGYDQGAWQFRYIHARSRLANSNESMRPLLGALTASGASRFAQSMDFKGSASAYNSLGTSYDDGTWQAQLAINAIQHETSAIENSQAGYLLVGRRMGNWSPFVIFSRSKSAAKQLDTGLVGPNFSQLNQAVKVLSTRSHLDSQTLSLGARWDFARNMDLKFQIDRSTGGSPPASLLYGDVKPGWNGKTTLLSVALDFVF